MIEAFTLLLKNIANLFKVKTILSLLVIITTCILTFRNIVSVEAFMAIAASIITYYFTRTEDNNIENITDYEREIEDDEKISEENMESE